MAQETAGGETLWMLTDHQGSVRDLVRNDGTIAAHYQYDSFGKPLDGLENITRFGYAGYERDTATGYYKTDTRWYDPQSGKWISEDPIGFAGGDANLSRYVGNSATNATDPTGLWTFWNPLTWGVSSPNQGWLETFNPLSRESRAAFGGFYQGGKESGEVMAMGVVHAGGEIGANYRDAGAMAIDTVSTVCGYPINFEPWSSAGKSYDPSTDPEWYVVSGQRTAETAVVVGRNAITAGAYDLIYAPNRDYLSTGDVQSYSNVGVAALANMAAARSLARRMAPSTPSTCAPPTVQAKGPAKPSPKFAAPTNPPQLPPAQVPPGVRLFSGKPTQQYPHGYWKLEKFDGQGWQRLDPRTMKPGRHEDTHVPYPDTYTGPFDN